MLAQFLGDLRAWRAEWGVPDTSGDPALWWVLVLEEWEELRNAIEEGDPEHIAKEWADLIYVLYGWAGSLQIPADRVLAAVHASNMTKLGPDAVMREDGKVCKGPSYAPPDIVQVLADARSLSR